MTDPYLNLFRNLIPPLMGQIDFTPIFGFMVLQFLVQVLGAFLLKQRLTPRQTLLCRSPQRLTGMLIMSLLVQAPTTSTPSK